ncbi:hypothetical protein BGX21_000846 [Mortierella sp. AD011]|nr:hypothetical protein BGX20_001078 [Mortierella sp. AD010]KAF9401719.1 hypothetical protein BGX21_000846 [Mortierella sp. AD011]
MGFWSSISDAFSRDGSVTCFLEKVPIVGYGVAGVQAIAGNTDHAKRALATSTGSLITTAGSVGGFMVGGPVGAAAGAAVASQVGMVTEFGISKTISDDNVKGNVGEISLKRALLGATMSGATALGPVDPNLVDSMSEPDLPWADANVTVEVQVEEYEKKKQRQGQQGLWENVNDQTEAIIYLIESKQPVPATVQKIADMYFRFKHIHDETREHALHIELQLRVLQELVREEVEMKEF